MLIITLEAWWMDSCTGGVPQSSLCLLAIQDPLRGSWTAGFRPNHPGLLRLPPPYSIIAAEVGEAPPATATLASRELGFWLNGTSTVGAH